MNGHRPFPNAEEHARLAAIEARIDEAIGVRPPAPPAEPWRDTVGNPIERVVLDVVESIDELVTQLELLKQRVQGEMKYARDTIDEIAKKVSRL
jgi:hypothetical protein